MRAGTIDPVGGCSGSSWVQADTAEVGNSKTAPGPDVTSMWADVCH